MKTRLAGMRPGLVSLFSWGSMPGSPEEVRGFLQRRMMVYLGFVAAFWAIAWLITTLLTLVTRPADVLSGISALRVGLHLGSVVVMVLLWWAARRKQHSQRWLIGVDLIATVLQGCLLAVLVVASKSLIRFRPDVLFILATTYSLIARAAVVPSAAPRTVLIGVMTCVPICVAVYIVYSLAFAEGSAVHHYYPGDDSSPALFMTWAIVFCSLSIALSAFVSFVIFGLQRQVQHARQLGQYTLETKIGEGGMGIVYRGRHALLRRPTAIKLLPPERAGDATVARFEREVQITSQLTHPNTVAIYDYGRTPDNVFYYAMEYLEGTDLETLVQRYGPLPPERARHFLCQIVDALAEAHAAGIIHRDVKPSNVFVCERGLIPDFVKVLDFGLARDLAGGGAAETRANQIIGTPLYMSPEQITGSAIDSRSDLYSTGALGYFLLTGEPVFTGQNVVEVCAHHLHSPVSPPSERLGRPIPADLESLILACLEKDPARRPRDAPALRALLAACHDVRPWTADDARRWWAERGPTLDTVRPDPTAAQATLTIDVRLEQRLPEV